MKYIAFIFLIVFCPGILISQNTDSTFSYPQNTAEKLLASDGRLQIGGYGEVHYNQPLSKDQRELGVLDVHRMVLFFGYNFSPGTQFVSEIEFEYAKELWVEQAFLQQRINKYINLRAGLLLIPMGIINENHEPTTFHGVERPLIDNKISPSTWREIGIGFAGNVLPASLRYQLYLVNGMNGYDGKGLFSGEKGLREGRQKGSKSYMSAPNYTAKAEYYGIRGLSLGLSAYLGDSQSKLYGKLPDDSTRLKARADSSVVSISMVGANATYSRGGIELRGQVYYTRLGNTKKYNRFTAVNGSPNDLGSAMMGYYAEVAYNVFRLIPGVKTDLVPFLRYEFYNMHQDTDAATSALDAYKNTVITTGLTFRLHKGAVLKTDLQWVRSAADDEYTKILNAGIGVMF